MINRNIYLSLSNWLSKSGRKPLVLRGARQVGKSTAVREFAKMHGLRLFEVNLERHTDLNGSFASLDLQRIMGDLRAVLNSEINTKEPSLLFLDEVQATPAALAALRYFFEDMPELPVIAAGSLLEFALRKFEYSMPVGRIEFLYMYPICFIEFLNACNETVLVNEINSRPKERRLSELVLKKILLRQRQYLIIGGMPEAVACFCKTESMVSVRQAQDQLLQTFEADFSKYSSREVTPRLRRVFNQVPRTVGHRVKYANFSREEKSREIKTAIELLTMAQLVAPVTHCDGSGIPLEATERPDIYKLIFVDVGLMSASLRTPIEAVINDGERILINEGALAEQFVGQELLALGDHTRKMNLHYWTRMGGSGNAEIDYLISVGKEIIPIEVKSGKTGTLRSLHQFIKEHHAKVAFRFDLSMPSTNIVGNNRDGIACHLHSLPLFLVTDTKKPNEWESI